MLRIRAARLDDAPAWATVVRAASPLLVLDAASEAHEMRTEADDARRAVAEVAGVVVGVARQRHDSHEDHVGVMVMVDPAHRRCGVGSALMRWHEEHLSSTGRDRATTVVEDDPGSRAAAAAWGFVITRPLRMGALDPRDLPPPPAPPVGVDLVAIGDLGPRPLWEAHQLVARDDPSGLTLPVPYDEWLAEWDDPRSRSDLGRAALVAGGLAAYSLLGSAGDRAWSAMTGTLPSHRGRGLALLVKHHALAAAARAGITRAMTGNDAANAPMLAVNQRLGYRPVASPSLAEKALHG